MTQLTSMGTKGATNGRMAHAIPVVATATSSPSLGRSGGLRRRCNAINLNLGLGGTGGNVDVCRARISPHGSDLSIVVDADVRNAAPAFPGQAAMRLILTDDGQLDETLSNRQSYKLLRDDPLMDLMTPHIGTHGVAKIRAAAFLLCGYQLEASRGRLRAWVHRCLRKFEGPRVPKQVNLNVDFSLPGGTGSSLAPVFTLLVKDIVRSYAPSIGVTVVAKVVTPTCFLSVEASPDEIARNFSNAAMAIREILWCQTPANLAGLAQALGARTPCRPLFDKVVVFDVVDSGESAVALETIYEQMAIHAIAFENETFRHITSSHATNSKGASVGTLGDESSLTIFEAAGAAVAKVPLETLSKLFAASRLESLLASAMAPAEDLRVAKLAADHFAGLELGLAERRIRETLSPNRNLAVPALERLRNEEALMAFDRLAGRWRARDRQAMASRAQLLSRDLERGSLRRARSCVATLVQAASGLPELARVLQDLIDELNARLQHTQAERDQIAAFDGEGALRTARAKVERGGFGRGKVQRAEAQSALLHSIESETRNSHLQLLQENLLSPALLVLKRELVKVATLEDALKMQHRKIERQVPELAALIGCDMPSFTHAIRNDEVEGFLVQLDAALPMAGTALPLGQMLDAAEDVDALQRLLNGTSAKIIDQFDDHMTHVVKDLGGFVSKFKLGFDVSCWVRDVAESQTMSARLNTAVVGPGQRPIRACVVVPPGLKEAATEALANCDCAARYELTVDSSSPFELIVFQQQGNFPVSALPNLADYEVEYAKYDPPKEVLERQRAGGVKNAWEVLLSTGHLAMAHSMPLLRDRDASDNVSDPPPTVSL